MLLLTFLILLRPPPTSTLFPYTTLFRSIRTVDAPSRAAHSVENLTSACTANTLVSEIQLYAELNDPHRQGKTPDLDRKSTRLNSSHLGISYAVFCLKKKKKKITS